MASETILNNRYRLISQLGSGGMAVIYKAIDQTLGRTVAAKILRPSLTSDPAFLQRFHNEARNIANLSHPNIVTVHDFGNDGPTHYIVMEFVEGRDLKKIIRAGGAFTVERTLKVAIQICAGIGFAHRAGLVHADVKPQNILLAKSDVVKVTDFGIAQALSDTQPTQRQNVVWGSPHYFAPEQAKCERPQASADVYAIGIVMFEMLTGRLPYLGTNQQELALAHLREPVPLVSDYNPNVPENLSRIIHKVMSKEPAARYRMADQLGHILENYRDQGRLQTVASIPPVGPRPPVDPGAPDSGQPEASIVGANQSPGPRPSSIAQQAGTPPRTAEPTQKYSVAPEAPRPARYDPSARPAPVDLPPQPPQQQFTPPPLRRSDTRFQTGPQPRLESPASLDLVTIALAVLALLAVACLIPLYIAVFQVNFGG
jgi:serine/threonine-protein kinase